MSISNILATRHVVGGQITVKITSVSYSSDGRPELVGEADVGTLRHVMVKERKRNLETLLGYTDDELTGLEVNEIHGKGVKVMIMTR